MFRSAFTNLFLDTGNIAQKTIRSGIWVGASFGFAKILSTAQQILLARLLFPSDFGLLGIALLTISTLDAFTQTGLEVALVQRRDIDDRILNAGWTFGLCRAFVLMLLVYAIAPYVAVFFQVPKAEALLQVLAISILLDGLGNIGIILYRRNLSFRQQVFLGQAYSIPNLVLSVGLAWIYRSVWAIVIARVASSAIRTLASYRVSPYRPRINLEWRPACELLHFGKYVFLSNTLLFLTMQGDDILVGKILGATALGFYTVAYSLSNTPTTSITHVISRVAFPAYAKLQDDLPALRSGYRKALKFTALLGLPTATGLLVLAPDIVRIVYTQKWMPMVPVVQILCIFGAIRALGATTGPVFHGVGRPRDLMHVAALQLGLTALLIYPFTQRYGILGTSIAVTLASFLTNLFTAYRLSGIIGDTFFRLLGLLLPSGLASGTMALSLYLIRHRLDTQIQLPGLLLLCILGAGIYALVVSVLDKDLWRNLRTTFRLAVTDT